MYADWRAGTAEFSIGKACDQLSTEPTLDGFNNELRKLGQPLFDAKDRTRGLGGGHARQWYGGQIILSGFLFNGLLRAGAPIPAPVFHRAVALF